MGKLLTLAAELALFTAVVSGLGLAVVSMALLIEAVAHAAG
jgi:hypothetical protein